MKNLKILIEKMNEDSISEIRILNLRKMNIEYRFKELLNETTIIPYLNSIQVNEENLEKKEDIYKNKMLFNYLICKEKNKHDKDNEEKLKKLIEFIQNQNLIEKYLNDIEKFSSIQTNEENTILLIQKILFEIYFFLHFSFSHIPNSQLKEKKKGIFR